MSDAGVSAVIHCECGAPSHFERTPGAVTFTCPSCKCWVATIRAGDTPETG